MYFKIQRAQKLLAKNYKVKKYLLKINSLYQLTKGLAKSTLINKVKNEKSVDNIFGLLENFFQILILLI